jgi:hypothetical protein
MNPADGDRLTLRDAALRWCDSDLVRDLRAAEKARDKLGPAPPEPELLARLGAAEAWRTEINRRNTIAASVPTCWKRLSSDLRASLESQELLIEGVQVLPTRTETITDIPGIWAVEFTLDFELNTLDFPKHRFVMVRIFRPDARTTAKEGSASTNSALEEHGRPPKLDVSQLTDDEIMAILNEHHQRVIHERSGTLFAPGKVTVMAYIRARMEVRAKANELLSTLRE